MRMGFKAVGPSERRELRNTRRERRAAVQEPGAPLFGCWSEGPAKEPEREQAAEEGGNQEGGSWKSGEESVRRGGVFICITCCCQVTLAQDRELATGGPHKRPEEPWFAVLIFTAHFTSCRNKLHVYLGAGSPSSVPW